MAVFSTAIANAMLDVIEATIGASPTLLIFDTAQPANTTDADVGNVLATMTLPADWMAAAAGRSKALLGTWRDAAADAPGTPAGFAIKQGSTVHMRGTCSTAAGSGEIRFSNTPFVLGQQIDITALTLTI